MTQMLTLEVIKQSQDISVKQIEVPEWGGHLYIRQLTRAQQDEYFRRQFGSSTVRSGAGKDTEVASVTMYGHDAWLCISACVDEQGAPLFTSQHEKMLKSKNGAVVGRIAKEIVEFSDMSDDIDAIEAEAKN